MGSSSFFNQGSVYTELDPIALQNLVSEAAASAAASEVAHQAASADAAASAASAANASAAVQAAAGTIIPGMDHPTFYGPGSGVKWAREDHVHPTDTSRAPLVSPAFTGTPTVPTAAVGTNTTQIATTAFVLANTSGAGGGKGIVGLLPANNTTTPNTKLNIAPGSAMDKDQTALLTLASGIIKTTSTWAVGTNAGALDTGSIAPSTGYHIYVVYNTSTLNTDILFSTSATAPTMPSGYTKRRRIGAFITDASGFIIPGLWRADGSFELLKEITVATARSLTLQSLLGFPVPLGVKLELDMNVLLNSTTGTNPTFYGILSDPDIGPRTLTAGAEWATAFGYKQLGVQFMGKAKCWANTSGQVYTWAYSATGDTGMQGYFYFMGWRDLRDEFS